MYKKSGRTISYRYLARLCITCLRFTPSLIPYQLSLSYRPVLPVFYSPYHFIIIIVETVPCIKHRVILHDVSSTIGLKTNFETPSNHQSVLKMAGRALHFVFKVAERTKTIKFYRELLGMKVIMSIT